jgi:hypothetical protein
VGATPIEIEQLVKAGYQIFVERGAGGESGISDQVFRDAGAKIVSREVVWKADIIRKVRAPLPEEYKFFHKGMFIESFLYLNRTGSQNLKNALKKAEVTAIAYEEVEKKGYRSLLDRVFFLEGNGADEDPRGRYIIDPMDRLSGSVSAIWAALYYLHNGNYQELINGDRSVGEKIIKENKFLLNAFLADIRIHLQEFMNHTYAYPDSLIHQAGLDNGVGNVLILGGSMVSRAAALDLLLLGAKKVTILVTSAKQAASFKLQFRKDGLLRQNDQAMSGKILSSSKQTTDPGGIDLNALNMDLDVNGQSVHMRFNPAMIANFRRGDFSGVRPVIIRIRSIPNPWPTLIE